MAKYASRVKETTTTTGAGTINLDGAVTGFRGFLDPSNIADQDYVPYILLDADGLAWEEGYGKVIAGTPNQLERGFVMDSSNGGAAIVLSTGTHTVGIGPIAATRVRAVCRVSIAAGIVISNNVLTDLPFDTEDEDPAGMFAIGIPTDIVIPAWANKIRATGHVKWAFNNTGWRFFAIVAPGISAPADRRSGSGADTLQTTISTGIVPIAGGSVLKAQAQAFITNAGTITLQSAWLNVEVIE
jgi:hypothetical protein